MKLLTLLLILPLTSFANEVDYTHCSDYINKINEKAPLTRLFLPFQIDPKTGK